MGLERQGARLQGVVSRSSFLSGGARKRWKAGGGVGGGTCGTSVRNIVPFVFFSFGVVPGESLEKGIFCFCFFRGIE